MTTTPERIQSPINTYDQLQIAKARGLPCVAITVSWGGARSDYIQGAAVYAPGILLDKDGRWGQKDTLVFHTFGKQGNHHARLKSATDEAKAFAEKRFGVTGWERNRMRDWVPAPINTEHPLAP